MKKLAKLNAQSVKTLARRARKNKGASSVEYIIVLIFIAITGIAVFKTFGGKFKDAVTSATTTFEQVKPE